MKGAWKNLWQHETLDRLKLGECKFACYETSFEMPSGQI